MDLAQPRVGPYHTTYQNAMLVDSVRARQIGRFLVLRYKSFGPTQ